MSLPVDFFLLNDREQGYLDAVEDCIVLAINAAGSYHPGTSTGAIIHALAKLRRAAEGGTVERPGPEAIEAAHDRVVHNRAKSKQTHLDQMQRLDQARYAVSEMREGARMKLEDKHYDDIASRGAVILARHRRNRSK